MFALKNKQASKQTNTRQDSYRPELTKSVFFSVPEYELIEPYLADPKDDFVSHMIHDRDRYRRELRDSEWNYVLNAFDKKMHLKRKRNARLVRPGLELETRHEKGDVTRTPVNVNSYFHGKIASDPDSFVAVGNADGLVRNCLILHFAYRYSNTLFFYNCLIPQDLFLALSYRVERFQVPVMYFFQTGMLRLSRDTFFIHPVPDHLTKHVTTQSKPHLIYKKSSNLPICLSGILAV